MGPRQFRKLLLELLFVGPPFAIGVIAGNRITSSSWGRTIAAATLATTGVAVRQAIACYKRRNPSWPRRLMGAAGQQNWNRWTVARRSHENEITSFVFGTAATAVCIFALAAIPLSNIGIIADVILLLILGRVAAALSEHGREVIRRGEEDRRRQRLDRDTNIIADIEASSIGPGFVLYLRPFAAGGRLYAANPRHVPVLAHSDYHFHRQYVEFEHWVAESVSCIGPMVSLTMSHGGVVVPADTANWQSTFKRLAQHSLLVLVTPFDSRWTTWEIEHLLAMRLLYKTVFLMPPATTIDFYPVALPTPLAPFNARDEWNGASQVLRRILMVDVPAYDINGGLFNEAGASSFIPGIDLADEAQFVSNVARLTSCSNTVARDLEMSAVRNTSEI